MATGSGKDPVAPVLQFPPGWPDYWTIPEDEGITPLPPGFPIDNPSSPLGLNFIMTIDPVTIIGRQTSLEVEVFEGNAQTDLLEFHIMRISVTDESGNTVPVKKQIWPFGNFADSIDFQITNYSGSKYGIDELITLELELGNDNDVFFVSATVPSIKTPPTKTITTQAKNNAILSVVSEDPIVYEAQTTVDITVSIEESGLPISAFVGGAIDLNAVIGPSSVLLKKEASDPFSNTLQYIIENYFEDNYGFSDTIILDVDPGDIGGTITFFAQVPGVSKTKGEDTTTIDNDFSVRLVVDSSFDFPNPLGMSAEIHKPSLVDTDLLNGRNLRVTAEVLSVPVDMKLNPPDSFVSFLDFVIGPIAGGHGMEDDIIFDLDAGDVGNNLDVTIQTTATPIISDSGSSSITAPPASALFSYGGIANSGTVDDNDKYTVDLWAAATAVPAPKRRSGASGSLSSLAYFITGLGSGLVADNDEYSNPLDSWTAKTDIISPSRLLLGSSPLGSKLYAIGGFSSPNTLQDNDEYTPDSWASKTDMPTVRNRVAVTEIGSAIYAVAGWNSNTSSIKDENEEYVVDSWTSKTAIIAPKRREHAFATIGSAGYAIGGDVNTARIGDNDEYVPDTWTAKTNIVSPDRDRHNAVTYLSKIYCTSGNGGSKIQDHDEYVVDTWASRADIPSPARELAGASVAG